MNIHEYQGKQLLSQLGVPILAGDVAYSIHDAERIARWLDEDVVVLKAQIHAGGRGKAGGVKIAHSLNEVIEGADALFNKRLITPQTPPEGKQVNRVYIEAGCKIAQEFYFCILVNRQTGGNDLIASREGGMDIEEVAAKDASLIHRVSLDSGSDLQPHHVRSLCYAMGLSGRVGRRVQDVMTRIYKGFCALDAYMVEINPLAVTEDEHVYVLDCKATFDDNALYRQRQVEEMRDDDEMDPLELEASRHDLNYVKLHGNIGLMVNGAGLSMATMDIIKHFGGEAANFMDVAGAATPQRVAAAFKLIYRDEDVRGILLNIFGGMMRCNDIAEGLVQAAREVGLKKPLVVRLEGTNVEQGQKILRDSGLPISPVGGMEEAARTIVEQVKAG
ncbi:MAG: ADP-forming succinate--CoA ligase subunit beta [Alphaproteobacteria bacterium GM202ARS2]|nr:ADP-forming succinate--CoA ligase subunit beta [Alphaproteobacteria bacterium GM202ARS2]